MGEQQNDLDRGLGLRMEHFGNCVGNMLTVQSAYKNPISKTEGMHVKNKLSKQI